MRGQYLHHSYYQADIKFSQDTGIFISQFHLVKSVSNSFHRGVLFIVLLGYWTLKAVFEVSLVLVKGLEEAFEAIRVEVTLTKLSDMGHIRTMYGFDTG